MHTVAYWVLLRIMDLWPECGMHLDGDSSDRAPNPAYDRGGNTCRQSRSLLRWVGLQVSEDEVEREILALARAHRSSHGMEIT